MRTISALTLALAVFGAAISPVAAMAQQAPTPKQAPSSSQQPSSPPANQIDSTRTQQSEKSLSEFWTPERLRDARPMPTPSVDPDEAKK